MRKTQLLLARCGPVLREGSFVIRLPVVGQHRPLDDGRSAASNKGLVQGCSICHKS